MACSAPPPTTVGTPALSASLSTPHDSTSKPAQIDRLNLTFPNSHTCTHRAAVQSNKVYLTPPASVRLTSFGGASDKRFSLGVVEVKRDAQRQREGSSDACGCQYVSGPMHAKN